MDAEHLEIIAGDECAGDLAAVEATGDVGYLRKGVGEDVRLATERIEKSLLRDSLHAKKKPGTSPG